MIAALLALALAAPSPAVAEFDALRYEYLGNRGLQVRQPGRLALAGGAFEFRFSGGVSSLRVPLASLRRVALQHRDVAAPGPLLLLEALSPGDHLFPDVHLFHLVGVPDDRLALPLRQAGLEIEDLEPQSAALHRFSPRVGWKAAGLVAPAAVRGRAARSGVNIHRDAFWWPIPAPATRTPEHPYAWLLGSWILRRGGTEIGALDCAWYIESEAIFCRGSEQTGGRPTWAFVVPCAKGTCEMLRYGTREGFVVARSSEGAHTQWRAEGLVETWARRGKRVLVKTEAGGHELETEWRRGKPQVRVWRSGATPAAEHPLSPFASLGGWAPAVAMVRWTPSAPPSAFESGARVVEALDGGRAYLLYSWVRWIGDLSGVASRFALVSPRAEGDLRLELVAGGRRATLYGTARDDHWVFTGEGQEEGRPMRWRYEERPAGPAREGRLWSRAADEEWVLREAWTYAPPAPREAKK
jgi:hypothetical protein